MSYFNYKNKAVFYEEFGEGTLLIMAHGNTASGRMFEPLFSLYEGYHIVCIDFLGHGRSTRIPTFSLDFWYDQGLQIIELLKRFPNEKAILLGSSGGAISALNAALIQPERMQCVIADSFEGEGVIPALLKDFQKEREASLHDQDAIMFYQWMQGEDYEQIVRADTCMMLAHYKQVKKHYHKPLNSCEVPVLLLGSRQDEMIPDIESAYASLCAQSNAYNMHLFPEGRHPCVLSNAEAFAKIVKEYLKDYSL